VVMCTSCTNPVVPAPLGAASLINAWNNLPLSTDFSSVNAFKRSISKTDFSEFLKYDV